MLSGSLSRCGCFRSRAALISPRISSSLSPLCSNGIRTPQIPRRLIQSTRRFFSHQTSKEGAKNANAKNSEKTTFLQRFLAPKPMPPRWTMWWYYEMTLICTVFAITGTSTMILVRPAVKNVLGLQGSFKEGPWSYRIASLVVMSPIYSVLLVVVGTVFGRHAYFRFFSAKMLRRFGIPPELIDKEYYTIKKTFKKW